MRAPDNLRTYTYQTAEFIVRPYEVACPRCTAQPWKLCHVLSGSLPNTKPIAHPARVAAAQRLTKYHVYEMSKGRLVRTFDDVPNAARFAQAEANRTDVEDIDAGTVIALGTGAPPPQIDDIASDLSRAELFPIQRYHREVQP